MIKNRLRFLRIFSVPALLLAVFVVSAAQKAPAKLDPTRSMSTIARVAAYLLVNNHFSQRSIDEKLSEQLFQEYFKTLDPSHMFFTRNDLKRFESVKSELGFQIRHGNVQFAFDVFKLFLTRLDEYEKFTADYLKTDPSLNTDETYEVNRSKAAWPANRQERRSATI